MCVYVRVCVCVRARACTCMCVCARVRTSVRPTASKALIPDTDPLHQLCGEHTLPLTLCSKPSCSSLLALTRTQSHTQVEPIFHTQNLKTPRSRI